MCLVKVFRKAYNSDVTGGIILCIYKDLFNLKTHSTAYIKSKSEQEGGIMIIQLEKLDKIFYHTLSQIPI